MTNLEKFKMEFSIRGKDAERLKQHIYAIDEVLIAIDAGIKRVNYQKGSYFYSNGYGWKPGTEEGKRFRMFNNETGALFELIRLWLQKERRKRLKKLKELNAV